jgi:hypothetical protein
MICLAKYKAREYNQQDPGIGIKSHRLRNTGHKKLINVWNFLKKLKYELISSENSWQTVSEIQMNILKKIFKIIRISCRSDR